MSIIRRPMTRSVLNKAADFHTLGVAALALLLIGCEALPMREDATAPLAPVPNGAAFAPLPSSVRAFERRGDEHAVRRGVYTSPGPDDTVIEISDLIVGPRAQANLPPDRAARVLDARSGLGNALISNRKEELSPMRPISLPAGNETVVRNDGDAPLVVRIYSVGSR